MTNKELIEYLASMNKGRMFKCAECGKELSSERNLILHEKTHLGETFNCTQCDKRYSLRQNLQAHVSAVHEGKMLKCTLCASEFETKKGLEYHLKWHKGEFKFKCEICDREFLQKSTGVQHMNSHYGIKPFECGLCGKKYADNYSLKRHLGECGQDIPKTDKCPQCDKLFKSKKNVRDHIKRVHEKGTLCLCNLCGRVFSHISSLNVHMKDHHKDHQGLKR